MPKKFNPKKCPYAQLLKHKGAAILFVEHGYNPGRDRIRLVSTKYFLDAWGRKIMCGWRYADMDGPVYNGWAESCYNFCRTKSNYILIIRAMQRYDRLNNLKILHIDFE